MIDWVIGAGFLVACGLVYLLMRWGWKRRGRRQSGVAAPIPAPADLGTPRHTSDLFYVATANAQNRLDRIVTGGLGFRARAVVEVHDEGVVLDLAGVAPILIPRADLRSVGRATWTIDRVVEADGLVQLGWRLGDLDVDTFLRDPDDPRPLIAAIESLIATAGAAPTRGDTTP
ncbi:hypothetical protein [Frondihabitans australicus]|uniref:PH domain-containing protein n=1 Tax=Frondihabitans australicus TaxID=386892 RepID=A0A495IDM7_9MICO|nr:hypothetical protein [Frondihabitans australicus]RKR74107.1 hypothetical protein C8E83_1213 [Frondihabitans australicus]